MKEFKNTFIETPGTDTVDKVWFFRVLEETKRILGSDVQVLSALGKISFDEYGKIKKSDLYEATKDTVDYEYLRKALEEKSVDIRVAWHGILDFRRYYIEQLKKMDIESPGIDTVKVEWLLEETRNVQIERAVSKIAVDEHGKIKKSDLFEVTKNINYEYLRYILEKEPVEIRKAWQEENQTKQHYNLFIEGYKGSWIVMESSKINNVRYRLLVNEHRRFNMPNIIADSKGNIIEEFNESEFYGYFAKFVADKKSVVFNDDELTEIYKCLQDTSCGEYKISEVDKIKIAKIGCKIEQAIPNIQERIYVETNENTTAQPQAAQIEAEFEI